MTKLICSIVIFRHSGLVSLLNKVGAHYYNIPPLELDPGQTFDPSDIRSVTIDKAWFLAQVTARLVNWC
jgi:hypothetical protein